MKYIPLFILLNGSLFQAFSQDFKSKTRFCIEPEINYSFIEEKNIDHPNFNASLSLGWGINAIFDINLKTRFHFLTGIRLTSSNYSYVLNNTTFSANTLVLSLPLYIEYDLNKGNRFGIGTDLSYRLNYTYNASKTFETPENTIMRSDVIKNGYSTIVTPIVLSYSHYFTTKNNRAYSLTFYLKKGIQIHEDVKIEEYENNLLVNSSTFKYKGSSIALTMRYYMKKKTD